MGVPVRTFRAVITSGEAANGMAPRERRRRFAFSCLKVVAPSRGIRQVVRMWTEKLEGIFGEVGARGLFLANIVPRKPDFLEFSYTLGWHRRWYWRQVLNVIG